MALRPNARPKSFVLVRRQIKPIRLKLHPFTAAGLALAGLVLLGWSVATTSYALFRDEFLTQLVARHTQAERAANAEIARLTNEVARSNSRLLIEREEFGRRLEAFAERQAVIERRQDLLSGDAPRDTALDDDPGDLRLRPAEPVQESQAMPAAAHEIERRFAAIEARQQTGMAQLKTRLEAERAALSKVYAAVGLRPKAEPVKAGLGGLYLPFLSEDDTGESQLSGLHDAIAEAERLRRGLDGVPVRSPGPGAAQSSGFGNRVDPFLGTMAFHSGVDFDLPSGAPARATASGTVVSSGWNGGYGLMVEVRHDHGFSTRYAHLSATAVAVGDVVKTGDVVGHVGSTGRSTGPHLHYETRLNDRALNPRRFLAAAEMLED